MTFSPRPWRLTPFTIDLMWIAACRDDRKAEVNKKDPYLSQHHAICADNTRKVAFEHAEHFNQEMIYTA